MGDSIKKLPLNQAKAGNGRKTIVAIGYTKGLD